VTIGETIAPTLYRPYRQGLVSDMNLHIRTTDMAVAAQAVRTELRRLAPGVAPDINPMTQAVAVATMPARAGALFTGGFGVIAALLATLGIYGLYWQYKVFQEMKDRVEDDIVTQLFRYEPMTEEQAAEQRRRREIAPPRIELSAPPKVEGGGRPQPAVNGRLSEHGGFGVMGEA